MKKLIVVLAISALCVSGCLSGGGSYQTNYNFGGIDRIAIVAVDGQIQNQNAKNQISDLFVMELLNKGYAPIPLAQVESRIRAMADTEENLKVTQDAYVQVGELLKVPAILVINVPYFKDEIFISAQLIDTKDGSVLWMDQDSGTTSIQNPSPKAPKSFYGPDQEDYLMDPLLLHTTPPALQQESQEPQETIAKCGDMPLSTREFQRVKNIVSKICMSLPSATPKRTVSPVIRPQARPSVDW